MHNGALSLLIIWGDDFISFPVNELLLPQLKEDDAMLQGAAGAVPRAAMVSRINAKCESRNNNNFIPIAAMGIL